MTFNIDVFKTYVGAANAASNKELTTSSKKADTHVGNTAAQGYKAGEGLGLLDLGNVHFSPEVASIEASMHEFTSLFPDPDADIFSVPSALGLDASDAIVGHYLGEPVIEA